MVRRVCGGKGDRWSGESVVGTHVVDVACRRRVVVVVVLTCRRCRVVVVACRRLVVVVACRRRRVSLLRCRGRCRGRSSLSCRMVELGAGRCSWALHVFSWPAGHVCGRCATWHLEIEHWGSRGLATSTWHLDGEQWGGEGAVYSLGWPKSTGR